MSDQSNSPLYPPLLQWRSQPELVAWAAKTFNDQRWQKIRQIMQEAEHPRLFHNKELTAEQKLGRIEGWDLYDSTLKWFAVLHELPKEVEATFAPAEEPLSPQPEPSAPKRK